jgi:hypothetical protein
MEQVRKGDFLLMGRVVNEVTETDSRQTYIASEVLLPAKDNFICIKLA